jgi:hypothetical protein
MSATSLATLRAKPALSSGVDCGIDVLAGAGRFL